MKVAQALASVATLALDTAPLIYYLELNTTYLPRLDIVFNEIGQGHIQVYTASITLTEVLTKPIREGNQQLQTSYRNLLTSTNNIALISINPTIAERAAELRARYNLKTPDALQIAVALYQQCDAFLTNDLGLKRVTEVQVLVLDELEL
ncbi:MAG TPA: PIN domain-containing protein [Aggregatilineales bacterium]|nr:PIN domain-containing protein [Aggregatilineales bacterium]